MRSLDKKAAEGPSDKASLVGLLVDYLLEVDNMNAFLFTSDLTFLK